MDEATAVAPTFDRTTEDVGNIVEYGHVNVFVPDQLLATLFYVSALGLTRDPYLMTSTDNMWINIGASQFHLPSGPAQVVRGTVGLVVPDLDALRRRVQRVRSKLLGTRFSMTETADGILMTCPWGNRILCHAPDPARFGPIALGTAYVAFGVAAGSLPGIAAFYREIVGAPATLTGTELRVGAGAITKLIYREGDDHAAPYDGHHIQISFADFSGPHRRLRERGLITEESDAHQYRFQALIDPASGETLFEVEHEVRSMRHPLFARPLVNRNPDMSNRAYAPGGMEVGRWGLLEH